MTPIYPSLVFPDTDIFGYRQFPLLLFGSPLYYLQPVEPDPDDDTPDENEIFIDSGLYHPHLPAPLADDRERFTRLIHDIRERKDDYATQLSALTMAALSEKKETRGGEERHQIISSLIGGKVTADSAVGDEQLDLWQARLVLAIAEILKREKEDLLQEMQLLDSQEIEMLRSLQGEASPEDEDPFAQLQRIKADLDEAHPREVKIRFQSWLRLMRRAPLPDTKLWSASSPEAADELFNEFEKRYDAIPLPILELAIPERIEAGPTHVVTRVKSFLDDCASLREKIFAEFEALINNIGLSSDSAENLLPSGSNHSSLWAEIVEDHFPTGSHGSATLRFYLLPNCPISTLLALEPGSPGRQPAHGLLAVLHR